MTTALALAIPAAFALGLYLGTRHRGRIEFHRGTEVGAFLASDPASRSVLRATLPRRSPLSFLLHLTTEEE